MLETPPDLKTAQTLSFAHTGMMSVDAQSQQSSPPLFNAESAEDEFPEVDVIFEASRARKRQRTGHSPLHTLPDHELDLELAYRKMRGPASASPQSNGRDNLVMGTTASRPHTGYPAQTVPAAPSSSQATNPAGHLVIDIAESDDEGSTSCAKSKNAVIEIPDSEDEGLTDEAPETAHLKASQFGTQPNIQHDTATAVKPDPGNSEPPLCPEQAEVVDHIARGRNVFYTGSAGCGKSTVLKAFTKRLMAQGKFVNIVAPTGRAALEIDGSTTWTYAGMHPDHHKLPLDKLRSNARGKYVRKRLKRTDVLVIDEISMIENLHFERLNAIMKEARGSGQAFGGVQIVVTGDFYQLPPVKPFGHCIECGYELVAKRSEDSYTCKKHGVYYDEDKWAFQSKAWKECNFDHFWLRQIHRQSDEKFIKILQAVRLGNTLPPQDVELLLDHPCQVANATKLYCTREEVRKVNDEAFNKLTSEKFSFQCLDHFDWVPKHAHLQRKGDRRRDDNSLLALGEHRYDRKVELKKGMLVVLLVNLDLSSKLCNGSQGIVCGFEPYDPAKLPKKSSSTSTAPPTSSNDSGLETYGDLKEGQVKAFISGAQKQFWPVVKFHNGVTRTIFADCTVNQLGDDKPYTLLSRTQIPLAPAWAMTAHKSQSLTLDRVIVNLSRAFEEGQAYVALSRATSLEGLKIEGGAAGLTSTKGGNPEVRKFHMTHFGMEG